MAILLMVEKLDEWGRRKLFPCPFCGAEGVQPNGKVFATFQHSEDCWILVHHRHYGRLTRVDVDDPLWNSRAKDELLEEVVTALQCLYDHQNGPPLTSQEKYWAEAMYMADVALKKAWFVEQNE